MDHEDSIVDLGQASTATQGLGMWLADDVGQQNAAGLDHA